ncbi:MAG: hypothetical protein JXB48_19935 [Candidatus Latescibacteria bacterium]|nr:hypothetical protein [Candidatus Latescibacterota bacterium]
MLISRLAFLIGIFAFIAGSCPEAVSGEKKAEFLSARAIWPAGLSHEKNCFVCFHTVCERPEGDNVTVRIAASSRYRLYVNGLFAGHGPARGPHGWYRIDEWSVGDMLVDGNNIIVIEAAGYNVNSYYLLDQPSFVQAEVVADGTVICSTGSDLHGFRAFLLPERVKKVQRYSFQRPFIEYYRLNPEWGSWRTTDTLTRNEVNCEILEDKQLIPRRVPCPAFDLRQPIRIVSKGTVSIGAVPEKLWKDRSMTNIGQKLGGYPENELDLVVSTELQRFTYTVRDSVTIPYSHSGKNTMVAGNWRVYDFGTNLTGFIGLEISCEKPVTVFLTFDEILTGLDVDFRRLSCVNAVGYELKPGMYTLESFEPYTLRYLKVIALDGPCTISACTLRELANPSVNNAFFASSNPQLNDIFDAARETFRQNATDIFMDCPSRERAGWLCDSYFTARVAFDLTGNTSIEHNFLENFLLPERFENLPEGMLPMCYPADHLDGVFIPNWALWFVLELEEYGKRSGDREMVDAFRERVMKLFDYFEGFENEYGLLESLESWVFVEWSAANKFVQDVNYPSNMLYAAALDAAGRMYGFDMLSHKAERIRDVVRKRSFDGTFFRDNAVRSENGTLTETDNRTEVCQYFAFYFGCATPETHPELWRTLVTGFGPYRNPEREYPKIFPANSFVGNYLRLELLSGEGLSEQVKSEIAGYFSGMAELTGTLWENNGTYASCNHGFASHTAHSLYRDIAGLYNIDRVSRKVELVFNDCGLTWCRARVPVTDGFVTVKWYREGDAVKYRADIPAGYTVTVRQAKGLQAIPE